MSIWADWLHSSCSKNLDLQHSGPLYEHISEHKIRCMIMSLQQCEKLFFAHKTLSLYAYLFICLFIYFYCYNNCHLQHEQASVDMFDHMIETNNLKEVFESFGLDETDLIFIKEQIAGPLDSKKKVSRKINSLTSVPNYSYKFGNIQYCSLGRWLNLLSQDLVEIANIFPWAEGSRENSSCLQSTERQYI